MEFTATKSGTPIGVFYMIIKDNLVIESGFGEIPDNHKVKSHPYSKHIDEYFNGNLSAIKKIKYIQNTNKFQTKVYEAMSRIPAGKTASYAQLAISAGSPKAFRAVGSSCAKNKIPLIIPCHRVIKSDDSLGNYAFGIEKKEFLLEHEAKYKN